MQLVIQSLVSGLLIGGFYALIGIGLTLNWGLMRVINLAHFSLVFLSAYMSYQISVDTGLDPFLTLVITIPIFFVLGLLLQWFFEKFEIEDFIALLVTFGMFSIFESLMREIWTADIRSLPLENAPYKVESVWIADAIALPIPRLAAFITAAALSYLIWYFLNHTFIGKALRAIAQDRAIAAAFGIQHRRAALLLGGIVGASAAIAGAFATVILGGLSPDTASEFIGLVFAVVILGGLGNVGGAFGAGILIGVVDSLTDITVGPGFSPLVTFSLLILVLLFRPQGLFTRRAG